MYVMGSGSPLTSQRNFKNTVYLFGASTIYNSEVPDYLTVASQLQLFFNEHYKDRFIVQNYGTTTVTVAQQLERLKTISLRPGDIVVFYDGINDIIQGLFYASPEETMIEETAVFWGEMTSVRRMLFAIQQWSSLSQVCLDPINRILPPHLYDTVLVDQLLASLKLLSQENNCRRRCLCNENLERSSIIFFSLTSTPVRSFLNMRSSYLGTTTLIQSG